MADNATRSQSYTSLGESSLWTVRNRIRPISCFKDVSEYFFSCVVVVSIGQSLLSKMHVPAVPQRHWSWDLRTKLDSLSSSSILQHNEGFSPTFIWAWKYQTLPKYSTLKKQIPLTQTTNVALHFRDSRHRVHTGKFYRKDNWNFWLGFSEQPFHMPFWLYSALIPRGQIIEPSLLKIKQSPHML